MNWADESHRVNLICRPIGTSATGRVFGALVYYARCECGWTSEDYLADDNGQEKARQAARGHWLAPADLDDLDNIERLLEEWKSAP